MNRIRLLPLLTSSATFVMIGLFFYSPYNIVYYMILLGVAILSFISYLFLRNLLSKHVIAYLLIIVFSFLVFVYWFGGDFKQDRNFIFLLALQIIGCVANSMVFFYYGKAQAEEMKLKGYPNSVIEKVYKNILFREVEKRIKGKVHPNALSKVVGGIATGVLTETLSSGRADLFSDNLIPAAMSIADSHLVNFESGNYSVTGSHANDFNPATGLAMTSDYFDAGGDAYGSALNHDSLFAYDNDISSRLDSHSIDHGSSFNSGFDNHHDY